MLAIRKESGEQLAAADDSATTTDPTTDLKVPDGVTKVVVAMRDLLGRGGPEYAYRLTDCRGRSTRFPLGISGDREQVPAGGAEMVPCSRRTTGYQGPIKLAVAGLPAAITVANDEIPAGASDALLSLTTGDGTGQGIATMTGTAVDPNVALVRTAPVPESAGSKSQPWLRSQLAVASTGAAPLSVV